MNTLASRSNFGSKGTFHAKGALGRKFASFNHTARAIVSSAVLIFSLSAVPETDAADAKTDSVKNWPQWRGPLANGVAIAGNPPTEWSESKNVKWKTKIPGFGTSTPVIWGDQVFILTAVPTGKKSEPKAETSPATGGGGGRRGGGEAPNETYQFVLLSIDRKTGKVQWEKTAREEVPHEGHHKDHGYASASPVTDGKHVLAYFGSRGLYCFDLKGNLVWEKDLGDMRTRNSFGEGSSPALDGNTAVIAWDHEGNDDFIVAFDKTTGKELWKKARTEPTSWSTPVIFEHNGQKQVVVNATGKVRCYDLASGNVLWECGGQTANAIPSPVIGHGMVYVMSGFRGNALQAIRLGGSGDLSGSPSIAWSHNKSTPYVPSPLLYDDLLYFVSGNNPMLSCFNAKTGEKYYEGERLSGIHGIYASPVGVNGKVYITGREGTSLVIKKSPQLEVLATNKLDDRIDASLAVVDNELFLRGHQYLYCIAEQ